MVGGLVSGNEVGGTKVGGLVSGTMVGSTAVGGLVGGNVVGGLVHHASSDQTFCVL